MVRRADRKDVAILLDSDIKERAVVGSLESSDPCTRGDWRYRGHGLRTGRRDRRGCSDRGAANGQSKEEDPDTPTRLEHSHSP